MQVLLERPDMTEIDYAEIAGNCLLFCLVFGMSATVDIGCMQAQVKNTKAILTGIFLQFFVLPFLGFAVVSVLQLNHAMGITLLVVTSSPGGSYSNWWCSMFNADLALSVTMTAVSTVLSVAMLPINLLIYSKLAFDDDIVGSLDWKALFTSLFVVIGAIGFGLLASEKINSHNFNMHANRLGNFAGVALVVFSAVMSSSSENSRMWERPWKFYVGVSAPCVLGLLVANSLTSFLQLPKAERVTASIECCYQNVGIATSVSLTMFRGDDLAEAMGVPLLYGGVEAFVLGLYCVGAWKAGWTKAPPHEPFWRVIMTSYEILYAEKAEQVQQKPISGPIEVQLSKSDLEKVYDDVSESSQTSDDGSHYHYFQYIESEPQPPVIIGGTPQRRFRRLRSQKEPSFIATTQLLDSLVAPTGNNKNGEIGLNTIDPIT